MITIMHAKKACVHGPVFYTRVHLCGLMYITFLQYYKSVTVETCHCQIQLSGQYCKHSIERELIVQNQTLPDSGQSE